MRKKQSITTKKGDKGKSRLFSGEVVHKNCARIEALGSVDELQCLLGVVRLHTKRKGVNLDILSIQRTLYVALTELGTTKPQKHLKRIDASITKSLDKKCTLLESKIKIPKGFVIPGKNLSSVYLDLARCVTRRAECKIVSLSKSKKINNPSLLSYFNRLSDYLYLLARYEEQK